MSRARAGALRNWPSVALLLACITTAVGCDDPMRSQARYDPLEASPIFANGMASRPLVPGTVARGQLVLDEHFLTGRVEDGLATEFPERVARQPVQQVLARGLLQYEIFCAPCHDRTGHGQGMVPRRGFPSPPSFHTDRLRQAPLGHLFDVPTNGFGRMPSYQDRVSAEDRWAIAAYIRVLQFSQSAPASTLAPADLEQLNPVAQP